MAHGTGIAEGVPSSCPATIVAVGPYRIDEPIEENQVDIEITDEDEEQDLLLHDNGGSLRSYMEAFAPRTKCMLTFGTIGIALLLALFIGIICLSVRASSAPVIYPTTTAPPPPITTPTTHTTTAATTTTTTKKSPTTTSPTPHPGPPVPTVHPLPKNPTDLPPTTLILQVFYPNQVNYTEIPCVEAHPQTFKFFLSIKGVTGDFSGESDSKVQAKMGASKSAAENMFGLDYGDKFPVPKPQQPCHP